MTDDEWIRERLQDGEPPRRIIDQLLESGWNETDAEQAVWMVIGDGLERGTDCLLCKILPPVMSALALVIAVGVAALVLTGHPVTAPTGPVTGSDGGGGVDDLPNSTSGDPAREVLFEVFDGELSEPSNSPVAAPATLRVYVDAERRVVVDGTDIDRTVTAGEPLTANISEPGTYTVRLPETGSNRAFTVR